jgi:16S rRNA (cytidine1402-2'-O)-methyltransferase
VAKLIIVATPIGNLEDISPRALQALKECDMIFTEDKRVIIKLLNHYAIGEKKLFTFCEAKAERTLEPAISELKKCITAVFVSDAGMPVVSDPGYQLVERCYELGIQIDVIPGASAPVTAIAASGFPGSKFYFLGFIPRDKNQRRMWKTLVDFPNIMVFFESPNRIVQTLENILQILGDREVFFAREMTKIHQEFFRTTVSQAIKEFSQRKEVKGEFTVVLSGKMHIRQTEEE